MHKRQLFLDFDGVIVNTVETICNLYNQDFKYFENFKMVNWENVISYTFRECNCANSDYICEYFNQPRFFSQVKFMPLAEQIIREASNYYDITIVSMGEHPNLEGKKIWIARHLPAVDFIGVDLNKYSDKSHIDMRGATFIDDCAGYLNTSNADTKYCFGKVAEWNRTWTGERLKNWIEVGIKLEKQHNGGVLIG